ncbi:MAG: hypothetical protein Q9190_002854 [Brigantiaea leucoxantha]
MPRRGKRHYTEIWAEEDGQISIDGNQPNADKISQNQGRGSLDQMTDELAETDQISNGPMLNRLLSTMRFDYRPSPLDDKANGAVNGAGEPTAVNNGPSDSGEMNGVTETTNGDEAKSASASLPPATFMPESSNPNWKLPPVVKTDHATMDERIKQELRHIGFLGPEAEPDYDGHFDDPVAERLRFLQEELRRVSIENGARKLRVEELAKQRMAYQEYSTILEDLDGQVQQAYLKRSRTMGKNKKNAKRPGGPGGSGHPAAGAGGTGHLGDGGVSGTSKPGIGDVARQLMSRRQRWEKLISPVFDESITKIRGKDETIFDEESMQRLMAVEREKWDEEAE